MLASGNLTNEEAFLLAAIADRVGTPHRAVAAAAGPERTIPNLQGGITGREASPNRRGVELAGLSPATVRCHPRSEGAATPAATPPPT